MFSQFRAYIIATNMCISEYTNTLFFYALNIASLFLNGLLLFMQDSNCIEGVSQIHPPNPPRYHLILQHFNRPYQ